MAKIIIQKTFTPNVLYYLSDAEGVPLEWNPDEGNTHYYWNIPLAIKAKNKFLQQSKRKEK